MKCPSRMRAAILLTTAFSLTTLAAWAASTTLTVSGASAEAGPGTVTLNFPVSRTGDTGYETVLSYRTVDGTALAGTDYTATSGRLVLAAGSSSASIPVTVAASNATGLAAKTLTLESAAVAGLGDAPAFGTAIATCNGNIPQALAAADFNLDGVPDLVSGIGGSGGCVSPNGNLAIVINRTADGGSTLALDPAYALTFGSALFAGIRGADLNGDDKPDLVVLNGNASGTLGVFLNTTVVPGTLTFGALAGVTLNGNSTALDIADFDGDGKPDVAITRTFPTNRVTVFLNTTAGGDSAASFSDPFDFAIGAQPRAIVTGDFDGDGKIDLITGNSQSSTTANLSILRNITSAAGTPSFEVTNLGGPANTLDNIASGDFNLDSKPDLVVQTSSNTLAVLLNTGTEGAIGFGTPSALDLGVFGALSGLPVADFNRDGRPDIAFLRTDNDANGFASFFRNTTPAGASSVQFDTDIDLQSVPVTGPSSIAAGLGAIRLISTDLNSDGAPDVAALNTFRNGVHPGTLTAALNQSPVALPTLNGASVTGTITYPSVAPADTTPDVFSLTEQTGVARNTPITSNSITVSGIDAPAPILISGGSYSIGCNPQGFTAATTTISNGQSVCVRHISSALFATATTTTLSIGGVSADFVSTTLAEDITPEAFSFNGQTGVPVSTLVTSNTQTITGLNAPAPITVTNGEYSIGCSAIFTSAEATISNGQTVCVRHVSSSAADTGTTTTLTIGARAPLNGISADFLSVTAEAVNDGSVPGTVDGDGLGGTIPDPASRTLDLALSTGTLQNPRRVATPSATMPSGLSFPYGFIAFEVTTTVGGSVTLTLTVPPGGPAPAGYVKCTAGVCAPFPGTVVTGNSVQITLTDGGAGDSDNTANGVIQDPGAISVAVPAASGGGAMPGLGLLGLLGVLWIRRLGRTG